MAKDGKKGIIAEFAEFINRGNVMDMAVGVIIGGAFTAVVNALVTNVIQPLISFVTGGAPGMPGLSIDLNGSVIDFSAFISAVINFLITAAAVFAIVKAMNEVNRLKDLAAEKAGLVCPFCKQQIADNATRCPHCTSKLEGYENGTE